MYYVGTTSLLAYKTSYNNLIPQKFPAFYHVQIYEKTYWQFLAFYYYIYIYIIYFSAVNNVISY